MQREKESPATGGNRRGAKEDNKAFVADSRSEPEERKGQIFLRVMPDGIEQRYLFWPGPPCLRVEIDGNLERTATWNAPSGEDGRPVFVKPRGQGWQLCYRSAAYSRWVRNTPVAP